MRTYEKAKIGRGGLGARYAEGVDVWSHVEVWVVVLEEVWGVLVIVEASARDGSE